MEIVSHGVRTSVGADGATFVLRDGDRCYYAEEDAISPLWKGRRFPMRACISGWCMTHGQPAIIADIYRDARIPADAYRPTFVRSLAMAPVGRSRPVAALGAYWAEMREPRAEEVQQLNAIADAAAEAMARLGSPGADPGSRSRPGGRMPTPRRTPAAGRSPWPFLDRLQGRGVGVKAIDSYLFALLCILVATLVREAFRATAAPGLATFSTYYPAVLLAMLMGGRRAGVLAAAAGGLAAYYFFMPPLYEFVQLTRSDVLNLLLYGGACALIILILDWYKRALSRLKQEDVSHLTLAREQAHRVKNAAAVAESVVRQSLRDQPDLAETVTRRIRAGLAQIAFKDQDQDQAQLCTMSDFLRTELEPYDLSRFTLEGEAGAYLTPQTRNILSLVIHELATNAAKYGALSTPGGRVTISWGRDDGMATIGWVEAGGPPVQPPQKRGYGSLLLQRLVQSCGGSLVTGFRPVGVTADISIPSRAGGPAPP